MPRIFRLFLCLSFFCLSLFSASLAFSQVFSYTELSKNNTAACTAADITSPLSTSRCQAAFNAMQDDDRFSNSSTARTYLFNPVPLNVSGPGGADADGVIRS